MNYAVIWKTFQLDRLAEFYVEVSSTDRDRMATGVEGFNARVASDPHGVGESRDRGYRVTFPELLCIYFHVDEVRRAVRVVRVTRYGS